MPGFALLPTLDAPVSHMTLRLSADDMAERNEWIVGASERGLSVEEIATDVGLSVQRVKQILKPSPSQRKKARTINRKFKTPRDAAVADFMANSYHMMGGGKCTPFDYDCNSCWGSLSIIESEYDESGWPYDWAMLGQERYIEMCS